jgi:hypothetical protein
MTDPEPTVPIVCRPQALTEDERSRYEALLAELAAAMQDTQPLANGYAFRLRPDASAFRNTAEWIALERRCCPFLSFELRWHPGDDASPWLSLTGPEGTKAFLAAVVPSMRALPARR